MIRYSFSNYSTKLHGVIEGNSGLKSRKNQNYGYIELVSVPANYEQVDTTADIDVYILNVRRSVTSKNSALIIRQLLSDVQEGKIIRVGAFVIHYNSTTAHYEIFHKLPGRTSPEQANPHKSKLKQKKRSGPNTINEVYNHLQSIHQRAMRRQHRS